MIRQLRRHAALPVACRRRRDTLILGVLPHGTPVLASTRSNLGLGRLSLAGLFSFQAAAACLGMSKNRPHLDWSRRLPRTFVMRYSGRRVSEGLRL